MARILQPRPASQDVPLNEYATFHCFTDAEDVDWWINGSYPIFPSEDIPTWLASRGFSRFYASYNNTVYNSTLRVLGSFENNNTEITCQLIESRENSTAKLRIIGMLIVPLLHDSGHNNYVRIYFRFSRASSEILSGNIALQSYYSAA